MKETYNANIGGRLFNLESDAFTKLEDYINSLKIHFGIGKSDTDEIIEDIDLRIAEILDTKLTPQKQVITLADIEEVITIMGNPEDYVAGESEEETNREENTTASTKKLYRDGDNSILGGVCSGLAAYFGIETLWIRIAFVVLFFFQGFGLLAYILLWIIIPRAKTTSERLKMKGKPINVDNIQKSVKEEFNKVKENVHRMGKSDSMERLRETFIEILHVFGLIFKFILKFVLYIIGIALIISAIALVIGLILVIVQSNFFTSFPFWPNIHNALPYFPNLTIAIICVGFLILVPVLGLIIGSIKLLFGIKSKNTYLRNTALTAWVLALIVFIFLMIGSDEKPIFKSTKLDSYNLKYSKDSVLYIEVKDNPRLQYNIRSYTLFNYQFLHIEDEEKFYTEPVLRIERSFNDSMSIYIHKNSRFFYDEDYDNGDFIYSWSLIDTVLVLDKYFEIDEEYAWHLPDAEVIVKIPEGQKICIDETARRNLDAIDSKYPVWDDSLIECPLIMTDKGLEKLN